MPAQHAKSTWHPWQAHSARAPFPGKGPIHTLPRFHQVRSPTHTLTLRSTSCPTTPLPSACALATRTAPRGWCGSTCRWGGEGGWVGRRVVMEPGCSAGSKGALGGAGSKGAHMASEQGRTCGSAVSQVSFTALRPCLTGQPPNMLWLTTQDEKLIAELSGKTDTGFGRAGLAGQLAPQGGCRCGCAWGQPCPSPCACCALCLLAWSMGVPRP